MLSIASEPHEELELVAVRVFEEDLLGTVRPAGGAEQIK
jgi:hypothetical protein